MPFPIMAVMAIASMVAAQKQAADQKQAQQQAASASAAKGGGEDKGMSMAPVFQKWAQGDTPMGEDGVGRSTEGMAALGGKEYIDPASFSSPAESKINQSIFAKDANPAADTTGATKAVDIPTDDLDVTQVPKDVPSEVSGKTGMFSDMSTEDKIAMAAQLGSLLRGSDRQMPAPGRGGSGGPGINMQPVFQNTVRDLYK